MTQLDERAVGAGRNFDRGGDEAFRQAVDREADSIHVEMSSTIGQQTASIGLDRSDGTISASVTLKPVADLTVAGWPRDVIPDLDHVEGTVHTSQRGLRTGLVHACVNSPVSGSFMYLQDLTVLGDYFQATHASAKDTVSGEWPDLGFALPSGDKPLKKGEPARISSWHVAFTDQACEEPAAVAEQYLELLARLPTGEVPRDYVAIAIELPDDATVEEVSPAELPGWDAADQAASRAFGDAWLAASRSVLLRVPALAVPQERNALLNPRHPDFARITALPPTTLAWDRRLFVRRDA